MDTLYARALELFPFSQSIRRDLHRYPELGFKEYRTAGIVARELNELGIEVTTGVAETGVVGLLEGSKPGRVILLRFDMDALPIVEETGAEYQSSHPGIMHACGHDAHVAIGLTVARMLSERKADLAGSVKFVFQPAEEGMGGAERMIAEGVLDNPRPEFALAMHVWNDRPVGWASATPGPMMAGADIFGVKIYGRGGHGAIPDQTIDPVYASAQVITALQSIVSRNVPPAQTAVVSVTQVRAGETFNVIPPMAELGGTIRTFTPAVHERVASRFHEIIQGISSSLECKAEINFEHLTPPVVNDSHISDLVTGVMHRTIRGIQIDNQYITMGSEDMAFFLQEIPGCFIFVGSGSPDKNQNYAHHHPKFDIDEQVLPNGAAIIAGAALELLKSTNGE